MGAVTSVRLCHRMAQCKDHLVLHKPRCGSQCSHHFQLRHRCSCHQLRSSSPPHKQSSHNYLRQPSYSHHHMQPQPSPSHSPLCNSLGMCKVCGVSPPNPGRSWCESCYQKSQKS